MTSKPAPSPAAPEALGRVLLLRAFLGFTFCFVGLQKLANHRFFDATDPASIQAQLAGAARRSPVHALISPLTQAAVPLGILIARGELAVTDAITADLDAAGRHLSELHVDRAYLSSALVRVHGPDRGIYCKAWPVRNASGRVRQGPVHPPLRRRAADLPGRGEHAVLARRTVRFPAPT